MKKLILFFVLLSVIQLMLAQHGAGPCIQGTILEGLQIESKILEERVNYAVYLPPGYESNERYYPVVYLLHGYTDDESAWIQFGEIREAADRAIASREIAPMIIVMPDAGVTWYVNDYKGDKPYEEFIFREFIPAVEKEFRIRAEKEFRGVAGLSMGGYGSLVWSLRHPDIFSSCAAFSAGIRTDREIVEMDRRGLLNFESVYGPIDNGKLPGHWHPYSVLHLVANKSPDEIKKVRYYIDCGDDDFLYRGNTELHMLMRDRNIPHEYRVRNGAHNWTYWRDNITAGLAFISRSFHR